ncbi:MAG: phosphoribosylformylglycinamidine synthase II [Myxococcales bacterium]|nr:phosphoribosylformylglycinamidine synthase II [Myxococcales bacterium]
MSELKPYVHLQDQDLTDPSHAADASLTDKEYEMAVSILGRTPNKLELGIIGSMWSEHCSYKSSRAHLARLPTEGPHVLQGPGENAGIVDIGDNWGVCFKVESHNHPSFIEPFQGAATGVGGILRDVFTMGARPVAAMNLLRFGEEKHAKTAHLMKGVVAGIGHYGNCFGVPTVVSNVAFDSSYNGNILVNAFAAGVVKHDGIFLGVAEGVGNPVFYVGAKTGRDGIHGATMASDVFDEDSEQKRPTVQVGDPFKEKLLLEACLETFKENLLVGIQDMGAAGLTSSSFEMASRAGGGISLDLDKVPMRETGMTPYEIMLSESQERMLLVAEEGAEQRLKEIYGKWDLDCIQIGRVTDDGCVRLNWHGEEWGVLPARALADEAPKYHRPYEAPKSALRLAEEDHRLFLQKKPDDVVDDLVGSGTLASKKWVTSQYDHTIGAGTRIGPGQAGAALVEVPQCGKTIAVAIEADGRKGLANPRECGRRAVANGVLRLAATGARALGLSDCLNYGSPENPRIMWQMVEGIDGIADAGKALEVPVVSGNVSLYNETDGTAVLPTPTVATVGVHEDPDQAVGFHQMQPNDVLVLAGWSATEVEGSEAIHASLKTNVGHVKDWDLGDVATLSDWTRAAVKSDKVHAAAVVEQGGLSFAALRLALASQTGVHLHLPEHLIPENGDGLHGVLFGEDKPSVLLAVSKEHVAELRSSASALPLEVIGQVSTDENFSVHAGQDRVVQKPLKELQQLFDRTIPEVVA